jgi:hypothetical protein
VYNSRYVGTVAAGGYSGVDAGKRKSVKPMRFVVEKNQKSKTHFCRIPQKENRKVVNQ